MKKEYLVLYNKPGKKGVQIGSVKIELTQEEASIELRQKIKEIAEIEYGGDIDLIQANPMPGKQLRPN